MSSALKLLGFFWAAMALTACSRHQPPASPAALVVARPVHGVGGTPTSLTIRYPVEVAARYSNPMSFRVPGKLIERQVRIGDTVKKGQSVASLDPTDASRQTASAQAALDAAEHRLVFARQQLDRDNAQSAQNLIAANQLEQTQDAFIAAQSARDQAAAQLIVARNSLRYNTLIADHDGVITSENADTGQVVAAGQPIYGLAWNGAVDVTLDAAASDLGRISIGQAAKVSFPGLPHRTFEAQVREIAPQADPQSRTYRVKLTLVQPDAAVRLGMTGDAELIPTAAANANGPVAPSSNAATPGANAAALAKPNTRADAPTSASTTTRPSSLSAPEQTFTIPATAIFHQGSAPAVFVVLPSNSTLELRPVTVSAYTDHSAVVTSGLRDGENIVLAGVHSVYPGQHVTTVRPLFDNEGDVAGAAP